MATIDERSVTKNITLKASTNILQHVVKVPLQWRLFLKSPTPTEAIKPYYSMNCISSKNTSRLWMNQNWANEWASSLFCCNYRSRWLLSSSLSLSSSSSSSSSSFSTHQVLRSFHSLTHSVPLQHKDKTLELMWLMNIFCSKNSLFIDDMYVNF